MTSRPYLLALAIPSLALGQAPATPAIVGRWDLTVQETGGPRASWLEVLESGNGYLVGRFVGTAGSARPISRVAYEGGVAHFAIPPQWESGKADLRFEGRLTGDKLSGTITDPDGSKHTFTGVRAPAIVHADPKWGEPMPLFNGIDLTGWKSAPGNHWKVVDHVLTNTANGPNIITERKYGDFKLHVEFRYPKSGNSGIYLRGRYETQIEDSKRREIPLSDEIGGIYGFLPPNAYAALGPDQWQTYDITLVGRRVTVVLNGHTVIQDQLIPGPTGEALDSDEGTPGPIMLQGTESAIEYRNLRITPAR